MGYHELYAICKTGDIEVTDNVMHIYIVLYDFKLRKLKHNLPYSKIDVDPQGYTSFLF